MSDVGSSASKVWKYRFSEPGETVIETGDFSSDGAAEARARELSKSRTTPVVIHRHSGHIDAWEYVTEVDERP
ncbi:MAG: hypothetical protein ABSG81_10325 [Acidimicrobiales bacterium]|jgi:hypothetical protein